MTDITDIRNYWADKVDDWSQWADPMAKLATGMNKPLLQVLEIQPGNQVLDLASGVGEPIFSEAKLVGEEGLAIASDLVPEMLVALKNRNGSNIMKFSAADMQALPFQDQTFSHVSCRFGIMFVPDQQLSVDECYRVLKPKGKLAYLVWGAKENQRIFNIMEASILELFQISVDHDFDKIFSLHNENTLSSMLIKSGFKIMENRKISYRPIAPKGVRFWKSQLDMSFGHLLTDCSQKDMENLHEEIEKRLKNFQIENGNYQMKLDVRLVCGQKP